MLLCFIDFRVGHVLPCVAKQSFADMRSQAELGTEEIRNDNHPMPHAVSSMVASRAAFAASRSLLTRNCLWLATVCSLIPS